MKSCGRLLIARFLAEQHGLQAAHDAAKDEIARYSQPCQKPSLTLAARRGRVPRNSRRMVGCLLWHWSLRTSSSATCNTAYATYCSVHDQMKMLAFGAGAGSSDVEAVRQFEEKLKAWEIRSASLSYPAGMFEDGLTPLFPVGQSPSNLR